MTGREFRRTMPLGRVARIAYAMEMRKQARRARMRAKGIRKCIPSHFVRAYTTNVEMLLAQQGRFA